MTARLHVLLVACALSACRTPPLPSAGAPSVDLAHTSAFDLATPAPDMASALACLDGEECESGTCCATLAIVGSGAASSVSTVCESPTNDCSMGNIDFELGTITTKVCRTDADCAGYKGTGAQDFTACCFYTGSFDALDMFCGPPEQNCSLGFECSGGVLCE